MSGEQDLQAQVVVEAQDRATDIIRRVSGEMGALGDTLVQLASKGGLAGLGVAAVGAALGGITVVGRGVADQVEQLDLMATRTGVSVEALQVLRQEIKEMGGDSESLTMALTFLNRAIAKGDPLLKQLGITTHDTFAAFTQLSTAFASSDDTAKKTEIAYQLLGRGSAQLLGILPKLAASFDSTRSSMEAAGGVLSGNVLESARNLDAESDRLGRNWSSLMTSMRASTVPTANSVVEALNDMWDAMTGQKKAPGVMTDRLIEMLERTIEANKHAAQKARQEGWGQSFVDEYEGVVKKLELQVGKLRGVRAETEDEEANIMAAFDRAQRTKGKDVVASVTIGPPAEKTPREKEIEQLQNRLHVTREEAVATYEALQRISDAKFATNIKDQLTLGPEVPAELKAYNAEVAETARIMGVTTDEADAFVKKLHALSDEAKKADLVKKLFPEGDEIGARLADTLAKMLTFKSLVEGAFDAMFDGLTSGFTTAFHLIASGTATVGSVMKSIWQGVVDSIIAMLARLAAAAVVLGIISAVTGIPIGTLAKIAGAAGGRLLAGGDENKSLAQFGGPTAVNQQNAVAQVGSARGAPINVNVYGYDNHTIVQDLMSPSGKLRRAEDRIAFMGAY